MTRYLSRQYRGKTQTAEPPLHDKLVQSNYARPSCQSSLELHLGCSGWSHETWKDKFYPSSLETSDWLNYYSKIFEFVEIDSSFYVIPDTFMVKNWYRKTASRFKFSAKFPKVITHDKKLANIRNELDYFLTSMRELGDKLFCLIIQLPPSIKVSEGLELLDRTLPGLDPAFRYAVEVRDDSWFQDLAYDFFAKNNICMVWTQLQDIQTPPVVTTDFVYLRLIGNTSMDNYDSIRDKEITDLQYWTNKIKQIRMYEEASNKVKHVIVSANNSYTGFGPDTVNSFRKMIGLQQLYWQGKSGIQMKIPEYENLPKQKKLYDFFQD